MQTKIFCRSKSMIVNNERELLKQIVGNFKVIADCL